MTSKVEQLVDGLLPIPCRMMVRGGMKTQDGKPCALVIGIISMDIPAKPGHDFFTRGVMTLTADEAWYDSRYYGWRAEDILLQGLPGTKIKEGCLRVKGGMIQRSDGNGAWIDKETWEKQANV